jgi:hypothetical protein
LFGREIVAPVMQRPVGVDDPEMAASFMLQDAARFERSAEIICNADPRFDCSTVRFRAEIFP